MFMRVVLPAPFSPRSARISPSSTSRSTSSLATTPGKRLVIPLNSSRTGRLPSGQRKAYGGRREFSRRPPSCTLQVLQVVLGIDGDGPSDDPLLELIDLAAELGGDLALEVVVRRDADAVVLERSRVDAAALERSIHDALHGLIDGDIHV